MTATPIRAVSTSAIPMTTLEATPAKPKVKDTGVTTNSWKTPGQRQRGPCLRPAVLPQRRDADTDQADVCE